MVSKRKKRGSKDEQTPSKSAAKPATPLDRFVAEVGLQPHVLLTPNTELVDSVCLPTVKDFYAEAKKSESKQFGVLPELLTEGFDVDQVWEQLQLRNKPLVRYLKKCAKKLLTEEDQITLAEGMEMESEEEAHGDDASDEDISGDEIDEPSSKKASGSKKRKQGGLEDGFFNLDEMNSFLDEQEEQEGKDDESDEDDEEGLDYFEDVGSESDEHDDQTGAQYKDFFDHPEDAEKNSEDEEFGQERFENEEEDEEVELRALMKGKDSDLARGNNPFAEHDDEESDEEGEEEGDEEDAGFMDEGDEEDDEGGDFEDQGEEEQEDEEEDEEEADAGPQSAFERQQAKIQQQINKFEEEAVGEKSWLLKGEASKHGRAKDSLLAPDLEFEHTVKAAPAPTEERLESIEALIKTRILDELWDDVVRKEETVGADRATSSLPEVSNEKSKEGLGELYEQEYREEVMGEVKEDEMDKEEQEIVEQWTRLCYSLDALSNFHYTPKPPKPEMETRANVPAVAMEEAVPMAVSDAAMLAPEEVFNKNAHTGDKSHKGEDELTKEERRSRRRAKKARGAKSRKAAGAGRSHRLALDKAGSKLSVATTEGVKDHANHKSGSSAKFFKDLKENQAAGFPQTAIKKTRKTDKSATHFKL
eukprot:TRINITY_DN4673_c0_g1_i1.p1 TRINITY_DN4673_c0_g1~~TRINITY_DN4673_c0_g1_i1.p1  ORF type:complete len:645 (-),score=248.09 TRINITY_DN4673_c0_g1_i1:176-2110(-)